MDTQNNSTELTEKQDKEIAVHAQEPVIKTQDENISDKILRDGEFIAFDFVRKGLGDRDMFSTKVFFRALVEIGFIEKTDSGAYQPTEKATKKYPLWFKQDTDKRWGMLPSARDEFEEEILPVYTPVAVQLMRIFKDEKDKRNKAQRDARNAKKKAQQPLEDVKGLF